MRGIVTLLQLKKLLKIIYIYLKHGQDAFIYLLRLEAEECLSNFLKMGISDTEDIEDLLFHIDSYLEIPKVTKDTMFPSMRNIKFKSRQNSQRDVDFEIIAGPPEPTKEELQMFVEYIYEVEKQRAVERDYIYEHMKKVSFGFLV